MRGIRYSFNNSKGNIEIKRCNNSIHSSKAHFHNEVSVGLIESGTSKTEIDGNTYELTDKTLLIIPSNISHKCNPDDYKNWNFRMLYINTEWFKTGFNIKSEDIKFDYIKVNQRRFTDIIELIDNIESKKVSIENESKLLDYVSILLHKDNKLSLNENADENINIRKVKKFLDENYLMDIKLDDLSNMVGVSKYYLIRKFNSYYGLSPHQYLTNLRINHSKGLLKSNKEFARVAIESGFYDQSHFIKNFKEYTGVTPNIYKKYI